jgi:hypothetical protein
VTRTPRPPPGARSCPLQEFGIQPIGLRPSVLTRHGDARWMNDVSSMSCARSQRASQKPSRPACNATVITFDPAAGSDCLISQPLQELQQRAFVDRQFLQAMTLEPRHHPGDEPTRLAHLDDRDQSGVLIEWRERSAQVVRLSHGAPFGCRCRRRSTAPSQGCR